VVPGKRLLLAGVEVNAALLHPKIPQELENHRKTLKHAYRMQPVGQESRSLAPPKRAVFRLLFPYHNLPCLSSPGIKGVNTTSCGGTSIFVNWSALSLGARFSYAF
jgi:hypothetical protein